MSVGETDAFVFHIDFELSYQLQSTVTVKESQNHFTDLPVSDYLSISHHG